jgi:hypothetical protein
MLNKKRFERQIHRCAHEFSQQGYSGVAKMGQDPYNPRERNRDAIVTADAPSTSALLCAFGRPWRALRCRCLHLSLGFGPWDVTLPNPTEVDWRKKRQLAALLPFGNFLRQSSDWHQHHLAIGKTGERPDKQLVCRHHDRKRSKNANKSFPRPCKR